MHSGCSGSFVNGMAVVDKLRMMGFSNEKMPIPLSYRCSCGNEFILTTFEGKCDCGMVIGVTPCHASSSDNIQEAGINY